MQTFSPDSINVGKNIKLLREKIGISQDGLAQFLDTSREQVAYYENGSRSVPSTHLSKLSNLFCMNEFDFYEEDLQKSKMNIAFAFRADTLNSDDLNSIAQFKKIVRNYINMKTLPVNE